MIASVQIADVGARHALSLLRRAPAPGSVPGLRHANIALAAPLSGSVVPAPQLGRVGLIAFWDDEQDLGRFLGGHPLADRFSDGWQVRLEPLRMHGTWPGVPDGIPEARTVEHDGPAVVLTLGRLRLSRAPRFFRTSARAEAAAVRAEGLIWATGLARPPFVATCSLWESTRALSTYAYGQREPAHQGAIGADESRPFHHQSAFIRFRPSSPRGRLEGRNPLADLAASLGAA